MFSWFLLEEFSDLIYCLLVGAEIAKIQKQRVEKERESCSCVLSFVHTFNLINSSVMKRAEQWCCEKLK